MTLLFLDIWILLALRSRKHQAKHKGNPFFCPFFLDIWFFFFLNFLKAFFLPGSIPDPLHDFLMQLHDFFEPISSTRDYDLFITLDSGSFYFASLSDDPILGSWGCVRRSLLQQRSSLRDKQVHERIL